MTVWAKNIADGVRKVLIGGLVLGLAATPVWSAKSYGQASNIASAWQEPNAFAEQESEQDRREREQEKREREDEAREREQEKKEREQERIERVQEMYDDGREALDDGKYARAEERFSNVIRENGPLADGAMYWKAYAENQQGKREAALTTIAELKKKFATSKWKKDAEALEIEVRNRSGQATNPESQSDGDLKGLALQGLMNSDPQRGLQVAEKMLNGAGSPKEKSKILFVIAQNGSPESQAVLGKIAQGQSNPELQRKAVEYLGIFGGSRAASTLASIYASTNDTSVKRAVIQSYMISGNRDSLFKIAKTEKDESAKRDAIQKLGLTGGLSELQQLYQADSSTETRREILQAFFLGGDSTKMIQAAEGEKDPELRRVAIRNLGLMGKSDTLQSIYAKETDRRLKEEVLNAYFISGNAKGLVAIAKSEKDSELKKRAVEKLSLMNSKEGSNYLMELLNK
jgi:hypothetical protein